MTKKGFQVSTPHVFPLCTRPLACMAGIRRAWHAGSQPRDALRVAEAPPPPPRRESRDVYCYFDDDVKVHAPFDAIRLAKKLASGKAC